MPCADRTAPRLGNRHVPETEAAKGVRLACQTAVEADCTVTVDEGRLCAPGMEARHTHPGRAPPRRHCVAAEAAGVPRETDLDDQRPDWERLAAALAVKGIEAATPEPSALEDIGARLRAGGWTVDAVSEEAEFLGVVETTTRWGSPSTSARPPWTSRSSTWKLGSCWAGALPEPAGVVRRGRRDPGSGIPRGSRPGAAGRPRDHRGGRPWRSP